MTDAPEHAGALLEQVLRLLGMSQAALARQTGLTAKHVNQVCQGNAGISARAAVLFEEATGVGAEVWMQAQARCDIATARAARRDKAAAEQARRDAANAAVAGLVRKAGLR